MKLHFPKAEDVQLTESERLLSMFRCVIDAVNLSADTVYHPCCGTDITLSKAFPESRIIYADREEVVVEALRRQGKEAYAVDVTSYEPDTPVDLLVMINPTLYPQDGPLSALRLGGYILCNDYHGTARELRRNASCTLLGVVNQSATGAMMLDRTDFDDYWQPVQTDEELAVHEHVGEQIRRVVQRYGTTEGGILAGYARLHDVAYNAERERLTALARAFSGLGISPPEEGENLGVLFMNPRVAESCLPPLPSRKGHADCLFIFRKKT